MPTQASALDDKVKALNKGKNRRTSKSSGSASVKAAPSKPQDTASSVEGLMGYRGIDYASPDAFSPSGNIPDFTEAEADEKTLILEGQKRSLAVASLNFDVAKDAFRLEGKAAELQNEHYLNQAKWEVSRGSEVKFQAQQVKTDSLRQLTVQAQNQLNFDTQDTALKQGLLSLKSDQNLENLNHQRAMFETDQIRNQGVLANHQFNVQLELEGFREQKRILSEKFQSKYRRGLASGSTN